MHGQSLHFYCKMGCIDRICQKLAASSPGAHHAEAQRDCLNKGEMRTSSWDLSFYLVCLFCSEWPWTWRPLPLSLRCWDYRRGVLHNLVSDATFSRFSHTIWLAVNHVFITLIIFFISMLSFFISLWKVTNTCYGKTITEGTFVKKCVVGEMAWWLKHLPLSLMTWGWSPWSMGRRREPTPKTVFWLSYVPSYTISK